MTSEPWWDLSAGLVRMDWMLWVLAALAVASAVSCAMAIRARVGHRASWRAGAAGALVLGVLIVAWAAVSYLLGSSQAAAAVALVEDGAARAHIASVARSELSRRFAFSVVAAMPALVLGIGFLGRGRHVAAP